MIEIVEFLDYQRTMEIICRRDFINTKRVTTAMFEPQIHEQFGFLGAARRGQIVARIFFLEDIGEFRSRRYKYKPIK